MPILTVNQKMNHWCPCRNLLKNKIWLGNPQERSANIQYWIIMRMTLKNCVFVRTCTKIPNLQAIAWKCQYLWHYSSKSKLMYCPAAGFQTGTSWQTHKVNIYKHFDRQNTTMLISMNWILAPKSMLFLRRSNYTNSLDKKGT